MTTSIFIKTCKKDLEWLNYCLRSIWKFASGFEEVIVVADESCRGVMEDLQLRDAKLFYVPDWPNGYLQQQAVKLKSDEYTNSEVILFVDSDCVFFTAFSPETFMKDEKPILLKTHYSKLGNDPISLCAQKWKGITSKAVGWNVEWEYMRRIPIILNRSTVRDCRLRYPGLEDHLRHFPADYVNFSEFNVLGAFIEKYEASQYSVIDTNELLPYAVASHYWSWGGITQQIQEEIDRVLT